MTLVDDARALLPDLVRLRREIHADPELGLTLPRTQARVVAALEGLGLEITLGTGLDSVVAVLRGAHPGPSVLLRGDMDALPIVEQTDLDFRSENGAMHACGHDLHAAGLVGAARLLAARRDELHGDVVFMFQPGEELGNGAEIMVDEGVLDATGTRVSAAYGLHVVPGIKGVFSTRPGPIMAGALELEATIIGKPGHASQPHFAVDPVPAAAEIVTALQSYVTRRHSVSDPAVVTVTKLAAGGDAFNVIEGTAYLGGSVRVVSEDALARVKTEIPALIAAIAQAHGCTAEVRLDLLCPPTTNDVALGEAALGELARVFGQERVWTTPAPVMGSEDFSYVSREVPAVYFYLRSTPDHLDPETSAPNHTPFALFDDSVLGDQAAALAALALSHLQR
ncbi:M20 family metallopeptidase [Microbacterium sp. zg.Y1090]|uniref:M20 metallopeptidase family protein n=1 Tax=Microbacterium wangruii TaxID=3049073 RepID=UPI00214C070B|nr:MULTISPECIES: M20 family metallopeptidase [unclassified Microbacterium]MCR2817400.1 M20 family metallopeptidase [Microbacterium sp. zg.Y1090]WIM29114.1 M20 family metallopeptidase [Microbacterium sp. zg-Y1090]